MLSEFGKSSCQTEVLNKRAAEEFCCVTSSYMHQNFIVRQRVRGKQLQGEDPELKLIADFQEEVVLPSNDKR